MNPQESNSVESERFLKDGLAHYLPAVRALNAFIAEIASRIRDVLEKHDHELEELGIASSRSKLDFEPQLGKAPLTHISVGLKNTHRSGFYIYYDSTETPETSFYVGFWIWTPQPSDRKELFELFRTRGTTEGWEIAVVEQTLNIGKYVNHEDHFPGFESLLEEVVQWVVKTLRDVNFNQRFGPAFDKSRRGAPIEESDQEG
jgi:hypothetical protein